MVAKGRGLNGLAQEEFDIMLQKELLQVVERGSAGEGVLDHAGYDETGFDGHLASHQVVDQFNQAKALDVGPDDGIIGDLMDVEPASLF